MEELCANQPSVLPVMKLSAYLLLLLCLPACRVSQPPLLAIAGSEVITYPPVAATTPSAVSVSSASIVVSGTQPAGLARPTLIAKYQSATQPRRPPSVVRFVPHNRAASMQKAWQRTAARPANSTTTSQSTISPSHSFILVGLGALAVAIGLLALPSTATFGGLFLVALALLAGVVFMLFGLISYLRGLHKNGRKA